MAHQIEIIIVKNIWLLGLVTLLNGRIWSEKAIALREWSKFNDGTRQVSGRWLVDEGSRLF